MLRVLKLCGLSGLQYRLTRENNTVLTNQRTYYCTFSIIYGHGQSSYIVLPNSSSSFNRLPMASDDSGASAAVGLYEPEGMTAVREKYAELGGMVGTFSEKVGDVLSRAEVQFLQAYRGHMQEVRTAA